MAINIDNVQFKWFTAFTAGKSEDTIARIDGAGNQRNIVAKTGDTANSAYAHLFGRSQTSRDANNEVRDLFLKTVLDMFEVKSQEALPKSVQKAMRLKDFDGSGRPLTVRRITAVKAAIEADMALKPIKSTLYPKVSAYDSHATSAKFTKLAETLVEAAKGDVDLLNLLTGNKCNVARDILCPSLLLHSEDEVLSALEEHRRNLDELRVATKGDRALFEKILRQLSRFREPLPEGQITKLVAELKKMDLAPVKASLGLTTHAGDLKALCQIQKQINDIIAKTGVELEDEESVLIVQAELRPYYQFLYGVILENLDQLGRDALYDCLKTEKCRVSVKAAELIAKGKLDKGGEPPKAEVKDFAARFSFCAKSVCKDVFYDFISLKYEFDDISVDKLSDEQIRQAYEQFKTLM